MAEIAEKPQQQEQPVVPGAAGAGAAGEGAAPKTAEDFFEVMIEGKPVKLAAKDLPVDKLNPHLDKLRKEADRRMSEADRRAKDLEDRGKKYDNLDRLVASVKKDPAALEQLAREMGLTDEQLYVMSEKRIAERLRAQMRDEEEEKDPAKRLAREEKEELERLRRESEERGKEADQHYHARIKDNIEGAMVTALELLPKDLRVEAAREMVAIIRAGVEAGVVVKPEDLAKAAKEALRSRARHVYANDDEAELDDKILERAKGIIEKRAAEKAAKPAHPSAKPNPGGVHNAGKRRIPEGKPAGELLLDLLRTPK